MAQLGQEAAVGRSALQLCGRGGKAPSAAGCMVWEWKRRQFQEANKGGIADPI